MMKKYGWGFVGLGSIAHRFMADLPLCPNARLAAAASRSADKAAEFAKRYGFARSYGSYGELFADPDVDIVYVATPHSMHRDLSIQAMEAGKAVLCEKAVAVNAREVAEMTACARKNGVFFMEAMWSRFFPVNRKIKELISSGALGRVTLIEAAFCFGAWNGGRAPDPTARLYAPALAGGSLLDVGVYCASYAAYMKGETPADIQASASLLDTGVDGMAAMLLRYPDGAMAVLKCAVAQTAPQNATVYCEKATVEVPDFWHPARATVRYHETGRIETLDIPYGEDGAEGFRYEIEEVMACMDRGLLESPVMSWQDSLDVMGILDGARERIGLKYPFEA